MVVFTTSSEQRINVVIQLVSASYVDLGSFDEWPLLPAGAPTDEIK
jgi:hypothetical protein